MRVADQVMGLATKAGFPAAVPASIAGNALVNMDGWNCRMPSSSQLPPRASCSLRRPSSGGARAAARVCGTARLIARLSLIP